MRPLQNLKKNKKEAKIKFIKYKMDHKFEIFKQRPKKFYV